jgi:hypothetical protein
VLWLQNGKQISSASFQVQARDILLELKPIMSRSADQCLSRLEALHNRPLALLESVFLDSKSPRALLDRVRSKVPSCQTAVISSQKKKKCGRSRFSSHVPETPQTMEAHSAMLSGHGSLATALACSAVTSARTRIVERLCDLGVKASLLCMTLSGRKKCCGAGDGLSLGRELLFEGFEQRTRQTT